MIKSLCRHILTYGGGFLTAQGFGTDRDWEVVAGLVVATIGQLWSIWRNRTKVFVDGNPVRKAKRREAENTDY